MNSTFPSELSLIAGKGVYPLLLAEEARKQGVKRLFVVAFRGETLAAIKMHADQVQWLYVGQLQAFLTALKSCGIGQAVMAGQITPSNLFTLRPDRKLMLILKNLKLKNAETLFGAIADELKALDIDLLPASMFMESHMPGAGLLSAHAPDEGIQTDIDLGLKVARASSALDVGQTVVVKEGTVLAVEAFEGTNQAIARAARLGGAGITVVKVAKKGHDMRFDIPVVGMQTLALLTKARARAIAVEAGRAILLEREKLVAQANRAKLCFVAVPAEETSVS